MLRARLGAGGMGEVYKAEDTKLKRVVAIKRLSAALRTDPASHQRLMVEARRACSLNHPHIAAVYDIVEDKDELFLVMEYVEGITLRQRIKPAPLTTEEFLPIAIQCSEALAAAHERGIIHGDIKPDNIMLTTAGQVKLLDFGVARRRPDHPQGTVMDSLADVGGPVGGTPAYMAPEVLRGGNPDQAADIFALGIVYYECFSGIHPFRQNTMASTADKIFNEVPKDVSQLNAAVPKDLAKIINHMLAKPLAERYGNAPEVVADLRAFRDGAQPQRRWAAGKAGLSRKLLLGVTSAIVALMLLFAAVPRFRNTAGAWFSPGPAVPDVAQLVVLPFTAAENDPQSQAFAYGLSETINAKLTQLTGRKSLQVVPASEVQEKKVRDAKEARQQFGANMVLTGNLHRAGDRLRVTYSLVDTRTHLQLRSDAITVTDDDPFAAEDKVVEGVADMLRIELAPHEVKSVEAHGTVQPAAYDYYVQGQGFLQDPTQENVNNAITVFNHALEADPHYALALAGLGTAYFHKFSLTKDASWIAKAESTCSKSVSQQQDQAAGHICLGLINNATGKYEQAVAEFQRAAQIEPTSDDAYTGLANAYEELGKTDLAETTYKQAVSLRPSYWAVYNSLGTFYLNHSKYAQAGAQFQQLLKLVPDSYIGYGNLANTYFYQGRYEEAIPLYERSIAIHPTEENYTNLATAYFAEKQYEKSARMNEQARDLNPDNFDVWGNLGDSYYWAPGERDKAPAAYRKAISLGEAMMKVNPRDANTLSYMATYQAMIADKKGALENISKALAMKPHDPNVLFYAALIHNQFGDTAATLTYLRQALAAGYSPIDLRNTPNLDGLRNNPEFQKLAGTH